MIVGLGVVLALAMLAGMGAILVWGWRNRVRPEVPQPRVAWRMTRGYAAGGKAANELGAPPSGPASGSECPRGTEGCDRADCSPAPGHACYGPNAPAHPDMGD